MIKLHKLTTTILLSLFFLSFIFVFFNIEQVKSAQTEILLDSCDSGSAGNDFKLETLHPSSVQYDQSSWGQAFNFSDYSYSYINKTSFYVEGNTFEGDENAFAVSRLYESTGSYSTVEPLFNDSAPYKGNVLATSEPLNVTSVSVGWIDFTFNSSNRYMMQNDTIYCISIDAYNGTWNINDGIKMYDTNTHYGNLFAYWDIDYWGAYSSWDIYFRVYGLVELPTNHDFEITNMDENREAVYPLQTYYFKGYYEYIGEASNFHYLQFAFYDSVNWINISYNFQTKVQTVENGSSQVQLTQPATYDSDSNWINITWTVYITSLIEFEINIEIYMFCNSTFGFTDEWEIIKTDYFDITDEPPEPTEDIILSDFFESSIEDWQRYLGEGTITRATIPTAPEGTYQLQLFRTGGATSPRFYTNFPEINNGTWIFTYYYYFKSSYAHSNNFALSNGVTGSLYFRLRHSQTNQLMWYNGTSEEVVCSASKNAWHRITLEIDLTNEYASLWFDGDKKFTNWLPISTHPETITTFQIWDMIELTDWEHLDIIVLGDYTPPYEQEISFEIQNMEGCGNWLVVDKTYYFDLMTQVEPYHTSVNWSDTSGNWVNATYDYQNETNTFIAQDDIAVLQGISLYAESGLYHIIFNIILTDKIRDSFDIDVYYSADNSTGQDLQTENSTNYFNVYNIGGFAEYEISGDAGRKTGGEAWDLYAHNNSYVRANLTYYNFQHLHSLLHLGLEEPDNDDDANADKVWDWNYVNYAQFYGYWQFGIDYCVNDTWVDGWNVKIQVFNAELDSGDNWIILQIEWRQKGVLIKTENMSTMFRGHNEDTDNMRIWVDLWINRENASTVCSGRVSSYYWGMEDVSSWWVFWEGNWEPYTENASSQSIFTGVLLDNNDNVISIKDIEMSKLWCKVSRTANVDEMTYEIQDLDEFSIQTLRAGSDIKGVPTPTFQETKTPSMASGGFLSGVFQTLSNIFAPIGNAFVSALVTASTMIIGGLDEFVYRTFGQELFFTNILNGFAFWGAKIIDGFYYASLNVVPLFTLFGSMVTNFASMISNSVLFIVGAFTNPAGNVFSLIGGLFGYLADMWNGTGEFSGGLALKDIAPIAYIGIPLFIALACAKAGSLEPFFSILRTGLWIFNALKMIVMFGFNLAIKIIMWILGVIPF